MNEKGEIRMISLKIKGEMLDEWDRHCEKRGLTRSQFIRECANQAVKNEMLENVEKVVKFYINGLETRLSNRLNRIEALMRANIP